MFAPDELGGVPPPNLPLRNRAAERGEIIANGRHKISSLAVGNYARIKGGRKGEVPVALRQPGGSLYWCAENNQHAVAHLCADVEGRTPTKIRRKQHIGRSPQQTPPPLPHSSEKNPTPPSLHELQKLWVWHQTCANDPAP